MTRSPAVPVGQEGHGYGGPRIRRPHPRSVISTSESAMSKAHLGHEGVKKDHNGADAAHVTKYYMVNRYLAMCLCNTYSQSRYYKKTRLNIAARKLGNERPPLHDQCPLHLPPR